MMIRAFSSINNATFLYFAMIYVDAMQAINGQFMLCMCHKICSMYVLDRKMHSRIDKLKFSPTESKSILMSNLSII